MRLLALAMILLVCGCKTEVCVQTTKSWEGHYMKVDDFNAATKNIVLDKNESIWVLSDKTLNRVLKNVER